MKRKYPTSFFIMGLLKNFISFSLILLVGIIFLLLGFLGVPIFKIIGGFIIATYIAICIISQLQIRAASLAQSDNPEINEMLDAFFGVDENDENQLSAHERAKQYIEKKIKEHERIESGSDTEEKSTEKDNENTEN